MDLFEYQGKQYFARYDIAVSPGDVAYTVDEAVAAAEMAGYPVVVKAQVQVGGRGKAGGIKLADTPDEVRLHAGNILGMDIKGHLVKRVWVEHASDISKEYYASYSLDRAAKDHLLMLSAEGGVEIETVAVENPDAIVLLHINPVDGISLAVARDAAVRANIDAEALDGVADMLVKLYDCFTRGDCDLAEINPLILRPDGGVHALDAKVSLDNNARRGQPSGRHGCQLPRHRWWRQRRHDGRCPGRHQLRREREEHPHQHLRWHHPRRGSGQGHRRGAGSCRPASTHRHSPRRHQRRGRPRHPGQRRHPRIEAHLQAHHAGSRPRGRSPCERKLIMAIFVNADTKVIVQGLTGGQGKYHGLRNQAYGTQVVGGVTPGKGGTDVAVEGGTAIPVFNTVAEAVAATGATASFIAVPPKAASAAILEAAAAGIAFIVCITEGIPAQDEAKVYNTLVRDYPNTRLLGPNCPGIISPGKCNIGITAGEIAQLPTASGPNVGIVSRSGTLTYQALYELKQRGIGVSTCVGIGGDPVPGTNFIDCLREFQADPETHAIIMIGEIGGSAEEEAAEFIKANVTKPMSAYIAGVTAPEGKKMGHAGAITSGGKGTAQGKMDALRAAGVQVGLNPTEAGDLMAAIVAPL